MEDSRTPSELRDKARLASLGLAHTAAWLNVVPCPALGLKLRGPEFRIAVLYRLGLPVYELDGYCVACGQAGSDRYGHHAVSCGSHGERIARHNQLRDAIFATAASAHLAPTKEDRALLPNCDGRPADVLISNYMGGLHAALDVSVINPLQAQTMQRAAAEPGYALQLRHQQKINKYADKCLAEGIKFCPVVCETSVAWHPEGAVLLRRLGVSPARATGGEEEVVCHLFSRLSAFLMKLNALLLLHRVPTIVRTEVDGHM